MNYDWQAGLTLFALMLALTAVGRFLVFKVPALEGERRKNQAADKAKLAMPKYPPWSGRAIWWGPHPTCSSSRCWRPSA